MKWVHAMADLVLHRSPLRIGGRIDRAVCALLARRGRTFAAGSASLSVVLRLARLALPALGRPGHYPTRIGFDLAYDERSGLYYYLLGEYEAGTLDLIRRVVTPGSTMIDIGASVGQMSVMGAMAAGPTGRVLAFEAAPYRVALLEANARSLGTRGTIVVHGVALGDAEGTVHLDVERFSPAIRPDEQASDATVEVQMRRLDDILAEEGIEDPVLVKIDVEGAESIVLRGAKGLFSGARPPVLCFEYGVEDAERHQLIGSAGDVVDFLSEAVPEYRYFRMARGAHTPGRLEPVLDWNDVAYGDNVVACTAANLAALPETAPAFA